MASGERDLTLRLVTKTDDFETKKAVTELDDLADKSETTGRKLADLEANAKSAGGGMSGLAGDASTASTSIGGDLSDAASTGSAAFGDMRDEAGAALMETAGSFDGTMQGAIDGVQGALPAIGASFGAIGLLAGSAAGVAIGLWKKGAAELKETISGLTTSLIADGGKLGKDSVLGKLEEFATDGKLKDLKRQAEDAKIPWQDLALAMAGDADALDRSRAAVDAHTAAYDAAKDAAGDDMQAIGRLNDTYLDQNIALDDVSQALGKQTEAQDLATEATDYYFTAAENAAAAVERQRAAAEETAAVQDEYTAALDEAAESAVEMGDAVTAGVDAVLAAQAKQLAAAADFEANTTDVYNRLGEDAVEWALEQGDQAEEAMQLLADAPQRKGETITANYRALGAKSATGLITGLAGKNDAAQAAGAALAAKIAKALRDDNSIEAAARGLHTRARTELEKTITLQVRVPKSVQRV